MPKKVLQHSLKQTKPFLTGEQWNAVLVIGAVIITLIVWFAFSFIYLTQSLQGI